MNLLTTIGEGLVIEVSFDYSPGEEAKLYGDNVHPGSPASVDITEITVPNAMPHCIRDSLSPLELWRIEHECFDQINKEAEEASERAIDAEEDRLALR